MSDIIKRKKKPGPPLSSTQKTFNRLKKKINSLQDELQKVQKKLDEALAFYYEKMNPDQKIFQHANIDFIKALYAHYKNKPKSLTKKERNILKELILDRTENMFEFVAFSEVDPEIRAIFKDLGGTDYEEEAANKLNLFKQEMEEMFKADGIDVDLSKIDLADDDEEIKQKILKAVQEAAHTATENEVPPSKPKSKKETQKEIKARELEELQKKGLGTIYKQLAKAFHPDLEQDPEQKVEKEKLMKRLTNAYEHNDLHTLLSLEMEWMNQSNQKENIQSDNRLEIYNSILKDQVTALQQNLHIILFSPKYFPLNLWVEEIASSGPIVLQREHQNLKKDIREFQHLIENLKKPNAEKFIKPILQEYIEMQDFQEGLEEFAEFLLFGKLFR